jgi:Tol biopolymer transport system component
VTTLKDGRIGTAILLPDGTVERELHIPDPTLNLPCTVWSPDDKRLACEGFNDTKPSQNGLYTVRAADGGDLVRVTTAPAGMHDFPGSYHPDGRRLIVQRTTGEGDAPLMLVDAKGGEPRRLTRLAYAGGGFSPAGDRVLASGGRKLVFLDLDGRVVNSIQEPGWVLFGAVWSPDGKWIAYSRTRPGVFAADIYVSRVDGSDVWQVTTTPANEINVDWGPGA